MRSVKTPPDRNNLIKFGIMKNGRTAPVRRPLPGLRAAARCRKNIPGGRRGPRVPESREAVENLVRGTVGEIRVVARLQKDAAALMLESEGCPGKRVAERVRGQLIRDLADGLGASRKGYVRRDPGAERFSGGGKCLLRGIQG